MGATQFVRCEYYPIRPRDEYSAITCNYSTMTLGEVVDRLSVLEQVREILLEAPELDPNNIDYEAACQLNSAFTLAWKIIELNHS